MLLLHEHKKPIAILGLLNIEIQIMALLLQGQAIRNENKLIFMNKI